VTGSSAAGLLTIPIETGSSVGGFLTIPIEKFSSLIGILLLVPDPLSKAPLLLGLCLFLEPKVGILKLAGEGRVLVRASFFLAIEDEAWNMMKTVIVGGTSTHMMTTRRSRALNLAPADWTIRTMAWMTRMAEHTIMINTNLWVCFSCFV